MSVNKSEVPANTQCGFHNCKGVAEHYVRSVSECLCQEERPVILAACEDHPKKSPKPILCGYCNQFVHRYLIPEGGVPDGGS